MIFLKLFLLEEVDLPLTMSVSISMFILDGNLAIYKGCTTVGIVENNVFDSSLMGTTIQDGSKRERSNCCYMYY